MEEKSVKKGWANGPERKIQNRSSKRGGKMEKGGWIWPESGEQGKIGNEGGT